MRFFLVSKALLGALGDLLFSTNKYIHYIRFIHTLGPSEEEEEEIC